MKKRIIALLQARTDSSRLPSKVLKTILDKPMIIHQLLRTKQSKLIDELVLVTSMQESDDNLSKTVQEHGFKVFRGEKDNVLKRFYDALQNYNPGDEDIIVRLTGDCPLHDPCIIDETINAFLQCKCDYLSNCIEPVYPDGLDVEVFNYKALRTANREASKPSELEHVTPYIKNSGKFQIKQLERDPVYPNWRLTVDEPEDFKLVKKIFEHFNDTYFSFRQIAGFLEKNKELLNLNTHINRNEGYAKSLKEDETARQQGQIYIKEDADKWFERNNNFRHNYCTEYLLKLFPKKEMKFFNVAEFGVGRGANINFLSDYVKKADGYDGSVKSIENIENLKKTKPNINGKLVNLGDNFTALDSYDIIIYGFFTYMISDNEFDTLVDNSKKMLNQNGYIYIYDYLSNENTSSADSHNEKLKVFKRNLGFYTEILKDFDLIDFRLMDNRNLHKYLYNENIHNIDLEIDRDDYNWVFCALFKLKGENQ